MASIKNRLLLWCYGSCLALTAQAGHAAESNLRPEQVDAHSLEAYESFWQTFETQQQRLLEEGQKKYQKTWREREAVYQKDQAVAQQRKLTILQETAEGYRQQLKNHPQAANRPLVLLNLAQVLLLLGEQQAAGDAAGGSYARQEAVAVADELKTHYRYFDRLAEAYYVQGIALTALGKKEEALKVWREMVKLAGRSRFTVYAYVAIGDHYFAGEDPYQAIKMYDQATTLLASLGTSKHTEPDSLMIAYRLAWSAYRGGSLDKVISASSTLLRPGVSLPSVDVLQRMQLDAVQLLGDALCESKQLPEIITLLTGPSLGLKASAVGAHAMQRFGGSNQHQEVVTLGEALLAAHPLAAELPSLLTMLASSYKQLGQTNAYVASLEKMILLLPKNSLWRSHHQRSLAVVEQMEKLATQAGLVAAVWNYDKGVNAGSARYFLTAASFYRLLLDFSPDHPSHKEWRLRLAHCYYFAANYDEAALAYSDLADNYKLDAATLEMASYQLVLTNEKKWRLAYSQALERGQNPGEDNIVKTELQRLLASVEAFANRFPKQTRTVDLLLIAAGACRDGGDIKQARAFWQKVLVVDPAAHHRSLALRGIVYSYVKGGSAGEVVDTVRRFLRLEDWRTLGKELRSEFLTVLARATMDEGERLSQAGQMAAGGQILTKIAAEFDDLPTRSKIYRDGAYMLALAGLWAEAAEASTAYLRTTLREHRGDMVYLRGRSFEFQLRFTMAAQEYYQVGRDYPRHSRAKASLERAFQLAMAEDEFGLAGTIAELQAQRAATAAERVAALATATQAFLQDKQTSKAVALAKQRLANSFTAADKLSSRLLYAKASLAAGQGAQAEASLSYLLNLAQEWREKLGEAQWAELTAEAHYLRGQEAVKPYQALDLWSESKGVAGQISRKLKALEELQRHWLAAAATNHPQWAPRSRYELAELTERCADEIAAVSQRNDQLSVPMQTQYRNRVAQLRTNAKELHSRNLIAHTKDPSLAANPWVQKSSLRLAGRRGGQNYRVQGHLPHAIHLDLPYQWSL